MKHLSSMAANLTISLLVLAGLSVSCWAGEAESDAPAFAGSYPTIFDAMAEKLAEESARAAAKKSLADADTKNAEEPAEKSTENSAPATATKSSETPAQEPATKPGEKSAAELAEKPAEKATEKPAPATAKKSSAGKSQEAAAAQAIGAAAGQGYSMEIAQEDLRAEQEQLRLLKEELNVIRSVELPPETISKPVADKTAAPQTTQPPLKQVAIKLPTKAVKGAEEELANTLYELRKYKEAKPLYEDVLENDPTQAQMAWAMLQIGNCERKTGNLLGAGEAYKKLMNKAPEHPWAREAEWWATQVAWWAQWDTVRRQQAEKDLQLLR